MFQRFARFAVAGAAVLSLTTLASSSVRASGDLITFDDFATPYAPFPAGYHGLNWSGINMYNVGVNKPNDGYYHSLISGNNVAYSLVNGAITAQSGTFTFNSVYMGAGWYNGQQVDVTGSKSGSTLFTKTVTVNATGPAFVTFDWEGVDTVSFHTYGGTDGGYGGGGAYLVMDNMTINAPVAVVNPVPEPGAVVTGLVMAGTTGLGLVRGRIRRRKA